MNIKKEIIERGLAYLDMHTLGERLVVPIIATVITDKQIAAEHKAAYIARHHARVQSGDVGKLEAASAGLKLAAEMTKIGPRKSPWPRRVELVTGVVSNRRRNLKEFPQSSK